MTKETLLFQINQARNMILGAFDNVEGAGQMTRIPEGFKNNLHWQFGHVASMGELALVGLTDKSNDEFQRYTKYFGYGTSPDDFDDETPDIDEIRALLEGQVPQLDDITDEKLGEDLPKEFMGMTKRYEQFAFIILHEGQHVGKIEEMTKLVKM